MKEKKHERKNLARADLYLLAITVVWGSTFSVTKSVLTSFSPFLLQGCRFFLAAIIVGIYTRRHIRTTTRTSFFHGIILGIFLGVGFALQTVGLATTTASKAGFLTGTMVVFTPILQMIIEKKAPSLHHFLSVGIVTIGLLVFTLPKEATFNSGDMLILFCAVIFSFQIVFLDMFTRDKFNPEIVFFQFVPAAIIGFLCSFFSSYHSEFSAQAVLSISYLVIFATVVALSVQAKYQRETTPTKAAIIYTMEPVFSAVFAYFFLREHLSALSVVGAAIMFTGLVYAELAPLRASVRKTGIPEDAPSDRPA
jgi:drug/metabolite transporter (DMT)-like permease